jgi:hypothetical protein
MKLIRYVIAMMLFASATQALAAAAGARHVKTTGDLIMLNCTEV